MTAVDPRVRVSLIESFGVEVDGRHLPLPRNAERLLAYLALRGGVHQRSHVSATLWLDSPEEDGRPTFARFSGSSPIRRTGWWR